MIEWTTNFSSFHFHFSLRFDLFLIMYNFEYDRFMMNIKFILRGSEIKINILTAYKSIKNISNLRHSSVSSTTRMNCVAVVVFCIHPEREISYMMKMLLLLDF